MSWRVILCWWLVAVLGLGQCAGSIPRSALRTTNTVQAAIGTSTFTYTNFGAFRGALATQSGPFTADTLATVYTSYGNTLGMWGPLAAANTYRFSSKEIDPRSGLYYYGYRYFEANLQRWLNRDPIQEQGGINLYGFVGNNPVSIWDFMGLANGDWDVPGLPSGPPAQVPMTPFQTAITSLINNGTTDPGPGPLDYNVPTSYPSVLHQSWQAGTAAAGLESHGRYVDGGENV